MKVTAERVDGAGGQQFATVVFTGTRTCKLSGFPLVQLADARTSVLITARAKTTTEAPIVLSPGSHATTLVHGPSTCNAPVSVFIVITPPHLTGATRLAMPLRACPLTTDPYT